MEVDFYMAAKEILNFLRDDLWYRLKLILDDSHTLPVQLFYTV